MSKQPFYITFKSRFFFSFGTRLISRRLPQQKLLTFHKCSVSFLHQLLTVIILFKFLWGTIINEVYISLRSLGRRGGGVILYVKESIQAYEIKLERKADCDEAVWCKIVSGNSKLTIGLVYRSPNINEEDNTKNKNAIKEVSKGECIIMGDFNHGHIQWNSLEHRD